MPNNIRRSENSVEATTAAASEDSSTLACSNRSSIGGAWSQYLSSSSCTNLVNNNNSNSNTIVYKPRSSNLTNNASNDGFVAPQLRFPSHRLYGREGEQAILKRAFAALLVSNDPLKKNSGQETSHRLVLIGGASGVGKSSLVTKTLTPQYVQRQGGILVQGKWEQFQRDCTTYAGLTAACQQLVHSLQPTEDQMEELQTAIQGSSWTCLLAILPGLAKWSHHHHPTQQQLYTETTNAAEEPMSTLTTAKPKVVGHANNNLTSPEAQQRAFRFGLQSFLRIVSGWKPIVLLVDDLQWADQESLELLQHLLLDDHAIMSRILWIGCYRDEVPETHPLARWIRHMMCHPSSTTTQGQVSDHRSHHHMTLGNLDLDAVNEMLADAINREIEDVKALARVVFSKTAGNVFFVKVYLAYLQQAGILEFNYGLVKWIWNLDDIQAMTAVTDNIVEIMLQKMQSLPGGLRVLLPMLASLGDRFGGQTLQAIAKAFHQGYEQVERPSTAHQRVVEPSETQSVTDNFGDNTVVGDGDKSNTEQKSMNHWIGICVEEGFVHKIDRDKYCWAHDRIQEAALKLVSAEKLHRFQYRLGETLLHCLDEDGTKENLFTVTSLLNEGLNVYRKDEIDTGKRFKFARLNLRSGKLAMASASFGQANSYFRFATDWLPDDHWESDVNFSLDLASSSAEAEYGLGDFESMERHCYSVINRTDIHIRDKFRAYNVLVPSIGGRQKLVQALGIIEGVLNELGNGLPRFGRPFHILRGVIEAKKVMKAYGENDFLNYKELSDEADEEVMFMLNMLSAYSYTENPILFALSMMKSFQFTLRNGVSGFAPLSFAFVGVVFCSKLKDYKGGRKFAQYALSLLESPLDVQPVEARTLVVTHNFVLHFTQPLKSLLKPILHGYSCAMAAGDAEYAAVSMFFYLHICFYTGRKLTLLDEDFEVFINQWKSLNQLRFEKPGRLGWQTVRNLLGKRTIRSCSKETLPTQTMKMTSLRGLKKISSSSEYEKLIWPITCAMTKVGQTLLFN